MRGTIGRILPIRAIASAESGLSSRLASNLPCLVELAHQPARSHPSQTLGGTEVDLLPPKAPSEITQAAQACRASTPW
jgi:hypothetical protein